MVWLNFSDLIPSLSSKISRLCSFQINHNFLMPHLGLLIDLVVPVEEVQVKDPVLPTMHHQIQQHLARNIVELFWITDSLALSY